MAVKITINVSADELVIPVESVEDMLSSLTNISPHEVLIKRSPSHSEPRSEPLSVESEAVTLETETNTEESERTPDAIAEQRSNHQETLNSSEPQPDDVWRGVLLDRAGTLIVGKDLHAESGSLQGYFFMDHDPQVRWVGIDEVGLQRRIWRMGQK